ncbi:flippase [Erwinia sp. E_sp_B01_3]|uniref:flippase n=1 Tax=Erwinia sp. E_sp_B01_3 TaxID=3039402 RepID=UPI0030D506C0
MEGKEEFKKVNLVKSFNSSFIAGMPALFVFFNSSLSYAVLGLVFARFLSVATTFYVCKNYVISSGFIVNRTTALRLMKYGGWITVSNIISPLMAYFDRFIIAHMMGASHVAYYTAPAEGVQRLTIFPGALSRAVFPRLCGMYAKEEKQKQEKIALILMVIAVLPVTLLGIVYSNEIMTLWMGQAYSGLAGNILKILLIGFLFNAVAQIPFSSIQAAGLSKVTAIIHLCELFPYLMVLYSFINHWGVMGAAIAWTLRVTVDCFILIFISKKINNR